ncbi:MAG: hypothetical protein LBJ02_06420, partial [Bifidobacteriaceae bacterium]|nr:hypothetical protein [Bifidobacteriaceae bacterium]
MDQTSLTLRGEFPARIEITGPSPTGLPLRVKLDNVTVDAPAGGAAFALTGDSNTQMTLQGDTVLTSSQGAGLQVPSGARLSLSAPDPAPPAPPTLTAVGGSGAGIGAANSGAAGDVTFNDGIMVYAEAGDQAEAGVQAAGIGGGAASGTRTVTINGGAVVAKGVGAGPGIGGIANVTVNGGFVSAMAGGGTPPTPAVGGLTSRLRVNGGNVWGDTGLASPVDSAGQPVYPVYAAAGLAGIDVAGADWVGETITPGQAAWDQAHGAGFPTEELSGVFWAPVGQFDNLDYTGPGGASGVLAANVEAVTAPYAPGGWSNVLAAPLRVSAQADGTQDSVTSTSFVLSFDPPVDGLAAGDLELANGTGRAVLGGSISSSDGGATWTVPFAAVTRQGEVSLSVSPPAGSAVDYAAMPMPVGFTVNKNLGLISGGQSQRYATPLAVLGFTGEVAGNYYYKVVDADDPSSIPASPQDLVDHATGQGTLLDGPNNLTLRGAGQQMDNPKAKTVYLTGYTSVSEELTSLYAIDVDPAGAPVTLTNANTAAGPVPMTTTSADTFMINSGLVNTADAKLGSVDGWWAQLNGLDGLRFDTDAITADGLTGARALGLTGANIDQTEPLDLTIRNVALVPTAATTAAIALANRANVTLNVEGVNTATGAANAAAVSVPQAANGDSSQITITSSTAGQLTATGGSISAGIGGSRGAGAGLITIQGNVRVKAGGGVRGTLGGGGAGIGGGGTTSNSASGAMGQIAIRGRAQVYATTASTSYAAAIGASGFGTAGNNLGAANWVRIQDQATVVAVGGDSAGASPAIGVRNHADAVGSVQISGGTVVARAYTSSYPAIAVGATGTLTITGGSVATNNSNLGTGGIIQPVNGQGDPLYPVYVPAATADGVDLTDKDVDFGVDYPLHTLTAAQMAWIGANGGYFPGPAAVPLANPADATNNTAYLSGWAWLPVSVYHAVRAGQAPEYDGAKALGADARATAAAFAGARTNVVAVPVAMTVAADGEAGLLSSTELTLALDPAVPDLTRADLVFANGTGAFTTTGDLSSEDGGATYTVALEPEITEGDATASLRSHGYLTLTQAAFAVHRNEVVGVAPLDGAEGRRFFTSILGGARFSSTWRGEMFYRYGGSAPASAQALVEDQDSLTAGAALGENHVPGVIDYTLAANQTQSLYVAVKG